MTEQETLITKLEKQGWSILGYSPYFTDKDGSNRDRYVRMMCEAGLPRKILESAGNKVSADRRECWSGCGAITECNPITGYCDSCQKFHEKCLRESIKPRATQTTINYSSADSHNRVAIHAAHIGDLDFTEADWQDVLHPNEGCL